MVEFALALIVLNHVDKKGDFLIRRLILEGLVVLIRKHRSYRIIKFI